MILSLIYSLVLGQLLVVAWVDFKSRKISNKWILVNFLLGLTLYLSQQPLYVWNWEVLIFPVGFIVVGFLLFLIHIMGAGDSKYLASLFLIVPVEYHLPFLEKLVISTVVTGTILLLYRIFRNSGKIRAFLISHHWQGLKSALQSRFSYAPVILLAWLLLGLTIWR